MMNERETKNFEEACSKYDTGSRAEALRQIRELITALPDDEDRAGLLNYEILWLLDSDELSQSQTRLGELKNLIRGFGDPPPDTDGEVPKVSLVVMTLFAEAKVSIREGKEDESERILDGLLSSYPKQVSRYHGLYGTVQLLRGYYLANHSRWGEAASALNQAVVPEDQSALVSYYRGHCNYGLGFYDAAKQALEESVDLGLTGTWESRAHYMLGLTHLEFSDFEAARREFELCAQSGDPVTLGTMDIWTRLEDTCRRLGLTAEAQKYRNMRVIPTGSQPN